MYSNYLEKAITANSSLVNFCEHDNEHGLVYEYYNTMSSFVFVIFGSFGLFINKSTSIKRCLNFMLIVVGILSAYYHAMLSELSHVMDIISISMILSTSMFCLRWAKHQESEYIFMMGFYFGIEMMLYTFLAFTFPLLHMIVEFYNGYKLKNMIENMIDGRSGNIKISGTLIELNKKYYHCKILFILSLIFWIVDFFLCPFLMGYHFHWIFHFLIAIMAYKLIELIDYFI